MKRIRKISDFVRVCVLIALFSFVFSAIYASDTDVLTTIILIDGEAELVDVGPGGEILKRYIAVPDYFSSPSSHSSIVRRSLNRYRNLSNVENSTANDIAQVTDKTEEENTSEQESQGETYCIESSELFVGYIDDCSTFDLAKFKYQNESLSLNKPLSFVGLSHFQPASYIMRPRRQVALSFRNVSIKGESLWLEEGDPRPLPG